MLLLPQWRLCGRFIVACETVQPLDWVFVLCRFNKILETTQAAGEYEKVTQGLYENYLEAKCKDPRLEAVSCVVIFCLVVNPQIDIVNTEYVNLNES